MQKILIAGLVLIIGVLLVLKFSQISIDGHWQATMVVDNGTDTLDIDLSSVELQIQESNYIFNSTLNKSESGTIEHTAKHLVFYPSSGQNPYKLVIIHLDDNALILDMKTEGTPRRIHFNNLR